MFSNYKIGDAVILHRWVGSFCPVHNYTKTKIKAISNGTIIVEDCNGTFDMRGQIIFNDHSFEKYDLLPYNDVFYQEKVKEIECLKRRQKLIQEINETRFSVLSTEQLEQIYSIIKQN